MAKKESHAVKEHPGNLFLSSFKLSSVKHIFHISFFIL